MITFTQAKKDLAIIGITLKKNEYNEFVVNYKGAGEISAYYTNDLQDAIDTGIHYNNVNPMVAA